MRKKINIPKSKPNSTVIAIARKTYATVSHSPKARIQHIRSNKQSVIRGRPSVQIQIIYRISISHTQKVRQTDHPSIVHFITKNNEHRNKYKKKRSKKNKKICTTHAMPVISNIIHNLK